MMMSHPSKLKELADAPGSALEYEEAEQQFVQCLTTEDLDRQILIDPNLTRKFTLALEQALAIAYADPSASPEAENRFLQRILYRINRLNFVWYGDLNQYLNERSTYVQSVRDRIESVWQPWETAQIDTNQLQQATVDEVKQALVDRAAADLEPPLSTNRRYVREQMGREGYRHLIAMASLDGLVESSRLCHVLGGAGTEIQATLIRVLIEEYGNGRFNRKHSTFYAQMMQELELVSQPEAYFDWVPWQVLACINHNFFLTQRKRHFLRYIGGFTYFEIVGPSIYKDYIAAASRLGLSDTAMGYWELHIREDERHGQWMVHQTSLPLADLYPNQAWEILLGYDQDKLMGDRAGRAVIETLREREG
jgi:Iron-containing redox enzyme